MCEKRGTCLSAAMAGIDELSGEKTTVMVDVGDCMDCTVGSFAFFHKFVIHSCMHDHRGRLLILRATVVFAFH